MNEVYEVTLANEIIRYSFLFPETRKFFYPCISRSEETEYDIKVEEERFLHFKNVYPDYASNALIENHALIGLTSRELLKRNGCVFHSCAFIHDGYCWLLTGPSGVGKTTQFMNWFDVYPEEITILSGDKPILKMENNGLMVYPSPWNGKECISTMNSAPLAGVIYLKQGDHNDLHLLKPERGIKKILYQFIVNPETSEQVKTMAAMTECMFKGYPVFEYVNLGNMESTEILRDMIFSHRKGLPDV